MITYNSVPVYNFSYIANAVAPSTAIFTDVYRKEAAWVCADWISFFKALLAKYGEAKAKEIWSTYWLMGVSKGAGGKGDPRTGSGLAYDSVPTDCRTFNSDFRAFVSKFKLDDTVYTGLGNIAKPLGQGAEVVGNVGDAITGTSKVLKYGLPILVATTIGLMIFYGVQKVRNA